MSAGPDAFWSSDHPFDRAMQQMITPPSVLEQAGKAIEAAAAATRSQAAPASPLDPDVAELHARFPAQIAAGQAHHAALCASDPTSDAKAVATLKARAAIAGFQLERMADGSFVVARWTMTRALVDVDAVEAFFRQAGVR